MRRIPSGPYLFAVFILIALAGAGAEAQECLPDDAASTAAQGPLVVQGSGPGATLLFQGAFGGAVAQIVPRPADDNNNGISDVCEGTPIANVGDTIPVPAGGDASAEPEVRVGGNFVPASDDSVTRVFWQPADQVLYANETGQVTVRWAATQGGSITIDYVVEDDEPTVFLYLTEAPNNGPTVDLAPVLGGNPPADAILHYNSSIVEDPVVTSSDVFVDAQNKLHARKTGVVVLEYRNRSTGGLVGLEVIEIRDLIPVESVAVVGDLVEPVADYDLTRQPLVTRGNNEYGFQHVGGNAGPTRWNIYAIRPNTVPANFEVFWFQAAFGNIAWPVELSRYTADWPADPQRNVRGADSPPVDLSFHKAATIQYQSPGSHANIIGQSFSTVAPGLATVMYTDDAAGGAGDEVSFVVVDTVDHNTVRTETDWDIGTALSDPAHEAACNDGYLFRDDVAHYDPDGLIYDRDTNSGRVFPVNAGLIEMWWFQQNPTRQGTDSEVCWPFKAVEYDCDWPDTPDGCIIIANEKGTGPLDPAKYQNVSLYEQEDDSLHGYNPNEEHAQTVPGFNNTWFAARDDLNTPIDPAGASEPYVLLLYRDGDNGDAWEMDAWRVTREVLPSDPVAGCPCDPAADGPCTFDYTGLVGQPVTPPLPLGGQTAFCAENAIVTAPTGTFGWNDNRGNVWFTQAGPGVDGTREVTAEFYEAWRGGGCLPWLDDGTGDPVDVNYTVSWPTIPSDPVDNPPLSGPDVYTTLAVGDTRDRSGFQLAEILHNEAGVVLIFPWKESEAPLAELPPDYFQRERLLPTHLADRLSYDLGNLKFTGLEDQGLIGIMSAAERDTIKSVFDDASHVDFRDAVDALYLASQQPGQIAVGDVAEPDNADWGLAIASGPSMSSGWVVIGYNGREDVVDPVQVEVLRVDCPPFPGAIQVFAPDCPFEEQLTLRWTGDCGGDCGDLEFYWQVAAGTNPDDYDAIDPGNNGAPPNQWSDYPDPERGGASGWVAGQNEITIKGANIRTLTDNWFRVKTRGYESVCGAVTESDWTDAQLAEGWIKRVKRGINPFDERIDDFHANQGAVQTYVSMIEQLGTPLTDVVPLSCDNQDSGLIEIYQAVLNRGKSFTVEQGLQYPPADQALILMAGNLADFYMLLGNEAYSDAVDPTIAIDTGTNASAGAIFSFQDQLPTNQNSLLYEELALLRGRDDRDTAVDSAPVNNRLFWNFTSGDGSVAYRNNYNITDRNSDGSINATDAAIMFPQGHGDAYGHYLTALKFYYDLLREPNFSWPVRSETVLVGQTPVQISYTHERKFARAAAARARAGVEIMDLTYREQYSEDPEQQWQGYEDPVTGRDWGVADWARRSHMGAQFDWLSGNSRLPAEDTENAPGSLEQVDRTTVSELRELTTLALEIQNKLDEADAGLNPLGLARNAVPFDISPSEIATGKTHFEQVYERAVQTLNNTIVVFNHANSLSNHLRRFQDDQVDFQRNVEDREADFNNRLIEIFGYPFPQDRDPVTGDVYGDANVPDLYHYSYIDVEETLGLEIPAGETRRVVFEVPAVDPGTGVITRVQTNPVEFNVVPGFGLVKPVQFTEPRKAPGEIQLARSDLLQANARLRAALENYDNTLEEIESQAALLESFYGIAADQVAVQEGNAAAQRSLNASIANSRQRQMNWQLGARMATAVANAIAEGLPTNAVAGLAAGGDFTAPARSAIRLGGTTISEGLNRAADNEALTELRYNQQKENLNNQTQIELLLLQNQQQAESMVAQIETTIRALSALEIEIYALQETVRQASGRYLASIARGQRLIEERARFRRQTAAELTDARYKDLAFRIFRNDALQKYRAQFDLAVRYVYLAAKAYDYETNLLSADPLAGEDFFSDIVRERTIGQVESGLPLVGRGLSDVLARLSQNFDSLKGQLRFNNPQTETNRFSLRRELFRVRNTGLASNATWQEVLEQHRVEDLRTHEEFQRYCDPLRLIVNSPNPQPGIVIPFETTITPSLNFFGWPASGGDSFYSAQNFTTKVRSVGVWFSNYNNTASGSGLVQTPRVFLVPAGADVMRVPSVDPGEPREWFLADQVLPVPFPLNPLELNGNRDWLPSLDNFGGASDFGRPRRFGDFRAFHDGGSFNAGEVVSDSRLIGRSVWNTRWLLIIPGINLLSEPEDGLDRFIYGNGNPGDGVTDILIFFQTYAYTSG